MLWGGMFGRRLEQTTTYNQTPAVANLIASVSLPLWASSSTSHASCRGRAGADSAGCNDRIIRRCV